MESKTFTYFIKICLILTFSIIVYFVLLYMDVLPKYEGNDDFVNMVENSNEEIIENNVTDNTNNKLVENTIIQNVTVNNQTTTQSGQNNINEGIVQNDTNTTKNITEIPTNIIQINT